MRALKVLVILPTLYVLASAANQYRELEWWESTVFYQIYPRSFKDSDGDGVGDLNGITENLVYLKELGVGATWLSPIFKSPMYDFGYDIADFYDIQPEYGTMEDFERLLAKATELDIKIVLDFVPNHTSNESVWFQEALKGNEKYYDYFVWEDPVIDENGDLHPPCNWISVFQNSAWDYREEVGKYYLHQFADAQPDLNFRNPAVVEEMKNVLRFWLAKGVAGFRVDAINHLFEVRKEDFGGRYPDEPLINFDSDVINYDSLDHIYTKDQDETYDMVYQWREVLDEFKEKDGLERIMMLEIYASPDKVTRYYGEGDREGAQVPFNFVLIADVDGSSSAHDIKYIMDRFLTYKPLDKVANWVGGNHDVDRIATRYSPELVDGINMILQLMPGIAVTYMGEEIGMVNGYVSWEDTVDPVGCGTNDPVNYWISSRDPTRTPFQWSSEKNAGFSDGDKTWLPVAEGFETLNVEVQRLVENSHLNIYRRLVKLREETAFRHGRYASIAFNSDVLAFRRWLEDEAYIVVVNLRDHPHTIDLTHFESVTPQVQVILSSQHSQKTIGQTLESGKLEVSGRESFVVKVVPT